MVQCFMAHTVTYHITATVLGKLQTETFVACHTPLCPTKFKMEMSLWWSCKQRV